MLEYDVLEKQNMKLIFKSGLKIHKLVSLFISCIFFLTDKFHVYKPIAAYFKHNSMAKNIYLSFKNYYYETLFTLNYGWLLYGNKKKVEHAIGRFKRKNFELLELSVSQGNPTVIFTAHIGLFFSCLFAMSDLSSLKDKEIICIAPKSGQKRKDDLEKRIQVDLKNFRIVDVALKTSAIRIAKTMKNNGIIICTMDYAYPFTKNKSVKFFNIDMELPVGLLELCRKYNASMIPMFTYIDGGIYTVEFEQRLNLYSTDDKEFDLFRNLSEVSHIIEKKVLQFPEQWIMWRTIFYK